MQSWSSKDPNEVLNYTYDWSAQLGTDVILTSIFVPTVPNGISINSQSNDDTTSTLLLSGGTAGGVCVFTGTITTAAGLTIEAGVILPIVDTVTALPTGYSLPSAGQLISLFPQFAGVANIDFWISRGARNVDTTWTEGDYAYAVMLYACYLMQSSGLGAVGAAEASASGFSEIRSGQLSLKRTPRAEQNGNDGSLLASNIYGRQYLALLRQNRGGPVSMGAVVPDLPYYPFYEWGDRG